MNPSRHILLLATMTVGAAVGGWRCGGARQTGPTRTKMDAPVSPNGTGEHAPADAAAIERFRVGFARIESTFVFNASASEMRLSLLGEAENLGGEDFPAAIATALKSRESSVRDCAYQLAELWAECDPAACRKWIMRLPRVTDRQEFLSSTGEVFSKVDPSEFLGWFSGLSELERQRLGCKMVYALADAGAKTDPEQGVRFVLEQGSLGQNLEGLGRLFTALAKSDPAAAAKQAAELPGGEALTSALNGVMRTWAQSDAAAARAWIGKLDDAMLAAHATASFAEGLAERDPRAAAAMVGALPDTQNCQETLREIVKMWSGKDTPAALAWIESLPSAEDRSSLAAAALATNLDEKPEEALNQMFAHPKLLGMESGFAMAQALGNLAKSSSPEPWLRRLGELPEEVRPSVVASGLQTWASRDLGAARTWAASQTAEPMRQSAYAALGRVAAKKDETEFKTWIGSQPAGDARDVALLSGTAELVRHASGAQRVALFDLAASASNREYGRSWIRQFASVENAGPELTRWLDATPLLTAQDKAVLRKEQSVR